MKIVKLDSTPIFIQINISRMGDKRGVSSDEIEVDADKDLVKVRKVIFRAASFDRIKRLDGEIRRYVRTECFPYETGMHLVPPLYVDRIDAQLKAYHETRIEIVSDFAEEFSRIKTEFPDKLRKLYSESDYNVGDVRDQFSMRWQFLGFQIPDTLGTEMFKEEQKKLSRRMEEVYEGARMILRETCLQLVTNLKTSLSGDEYGRTKRLSDSTVTKLREFVNNFPLRNITNDQELESLVNEIKELTPYSTDSLKDNMYLQRVLGNQLVEIQQKLAESVLVIPERRIRR